MRRLQPKYRKGFLIRPILRNNKNLGWPMPIEIRFAEIPADKQAVFRHRYEIYSLARRCPGGGGFPAAYTANRGRLCGDDRHTPIEPQRIHCPRTYRGRR